MRRVATAILVLLAVLAVGGAVVDRLMVRHAQERLLTLAEERVDLDEDAVVVIDGFPFLTQVAAGRLAEVRGTTRALVVDGWELQQVRVTARGVQPEEPYRAETVEINVTVPAGTLQTAMNDALPLPGSPLRVETREDALPRSVPVVGFELTALLEPDVRDGGIGVEVEAVTAGSAALPNDVTARLEELVGGLQIRLPQLPDGLAPTRLAVENDGLHVRLEGHDVELDSWSG